MTLWRILRCCCNSEVNSALLSPSNWAKGSFINDVTHFLIFFVTPFVMLFNNKALVLLSQNPWYSLPPKVVTSFMDGTVQSLQYNLYNNHFLFENLSVNICRWRAKYGHRHICIFYKLLLLRQNASIKHKTTA